jgi:hypothetical protein
MSPRLTIEGDMLAIDDTIAFSRCMGGALEITVHVETSPATMRLTSDQWDALADFVTCHENGRPWHYDDECEPV